MYHDEGERTIHYPAQQTNGIQAVPHYVCDGEDRRLLEAYYPVSFAVWQQAVQRAEESDAACDGKDAGAASQTTGGRWADIARGDAGSAAACDVQFNGDGHGAAAGAACHGELGHC